MVTLMALGSQTKHPDANKGVVSEGDHLCLLTNDLEPPTKVCVVDHFAATGLFTQTFIVMH